MPVERLDSKFFVTVDGKEAHLLYKQEGYVMEIYDVFTPEEMRGQGIAAELAVAAFNYAKRRRYKVVPTCPYIRDAFLKKHPEFEDIIVKSE